MLMQKLWETKLLLGVVIPSILKLKYYKSCGKAERIGWVTGDLPKAGDILAEVGGGPVFSLGPGMVASLVLLSICVEASM